MLREARELYLPPREPVLVDVPEFLFLMADGHGDPETSTQDAIQALFGASYRIKFALRRTLGTDHKVMPLEGFWSAKDMTAFSAARRSEWDWTLMMRQPDEASEELVEQVAPGAALRLERWEEGAAAQVMHIGPYSAEGPTIERLHAFIAEQGLERAGRHHEIYLGDPRRAAPDKLRTVLRQPVHPR